MHDGSNCHMLKAENQRKGDLHIEKSGGEGGGGLESQVDC